MRLGKLATGLLGFALVLGSGAPAFARNCAKDVRNAEQKLHQAIRRHGEHSRQAQERRRHLEDVRYRCRM